MSQNPSGALMLLRTARYKDQVKYLLEKYPQTRGDDMQLEWRYLCVFTPVRLKFRDFKELRALPRPETLSRRRRELQAEFPDLRPSEKTQRKRMRREHAFRHYYGSGNLSLVDFISD